MNCRPYVMLDTRSRDVGARAGNVCKHCVCRKKNQLSVHTSKVAQQARAYPSFSSMKQLRLGVIFYSIDPVQKWLPLNYSFVRIQNSLTNLIRDNKFFTIFVSKTRLVRLI